jgi:hypothetical protein
VTNRQPHPLGTTTSNLTAVNEPPLEPDDQQSARRYEQRRRSHPTNTPRRQAALATATRERSGTQPATTPQACACAKDKASHDATMAAHLLLRRASLDRVRKRLGTETVRVWRRRRRECSEVSGCGSASATKDVACAPARRSSRCARRRRRHRRCPTPGGDSNDVTGAACLLQESAAWIARGPLSLWERQLLRPLTADRSSVRDQFADGARRTQSEFALDCYRTRVSCWRSG